MVAYEREDSVVCRVAVNLLAKDEVVQAAVDGTNLAAHNIGD